VADVTAVVVNALQAHDFSVLTVNEKIGVVTTDWKDVTPRYAITEILKGLAEGLGAEPEERVCRMRITVTIDKQARVIKLKPIKQERWRESEPWRNSLLSEEDEKLLNSIAEEILKALGRPDLSINWDYSGFKKRARKM